MKKYIITDKYGRTIPSRLLEVYNSKQEAYEDILNYAHDINKDGRNPIVAISSYVVEPAC